MIDTVELTVAGVSGSALSPVAITGLVHAVSFDITNGSSLMDVYVFANRAGSGAPILQRANASTDGVFYPRHQVHDASAATRATGADSPDRYLVNDQIALSVAQAASNSQVVATVFVER